MLKNNVNIQVTKKQTITWKKFNYLITPDEAKADLNASIIKLSCYSNEVKHLVSGIWTLAVSISDKTVI